MCKKHTQTLKSDRFAPDFVWNLSEFWVFLKSVKIKVLFVSAWLLTKIQFYILPSKGEDTKTERVFISPHFCLENLPSKFLPCKLTLWGEEVKMLASFYLHPMVYLDFYRHFTLKKHQILPRSWGKIKKRRPFFQLSPKILWSFFTKPLHKGFFAAFCHLPDHFCNRCDTPSVTQKIVIPQL